MLKHTLKTILAMSAVASIAGCSKTIDTLIDDEISRRVNDAAGDRLLLIHGDTTLQGNANSATVTVDGSGNASMSALGASRSSSATTRVNFGTHTAIDFTTSDGTTAFVEANGDDIEYDRVRGLVLLADSANGQSRGFLGNPDTLDFDHQTYGMWVTGIGTSSGTVNVGSYGHETAASNVPSSGTARYEGNSVGYTVRADQNSYLTESNIVIETSDFSTVSMASANTTSTNLDGTGLFSSSALNFAGTGTVSGNGFAANVGGITAGTAAMTGTANGTFYGDAAEEVGGTFSLTGNGVNYVGSFGAEQ